MPIENAKERKRGDTKDNPLSQWFVNFSEADELLKLATARQQVVMAFLPSLFLAQKPRFFIVLVLACKCVFCVQVRL